jgi:molybdopterin-guanine dinucleotide biosynthesis protein A
MTDHPATIGVVLAGGLARRMGGGDKAMRTLGGETLLDHVLARMAPQCDALVLSANGDPARFAAFGHPVIADGVGDFPGPLAGILSALDWAAAHRPDIQWLVSVAADCPFLPRDLVTRLHQARSAENAMIAAAASGGQVHHVIALWSITLRDAMRHALVAENMRSVHRWTARYKVATADWPASPRDPFFNVNTAEDLDMAEQLIAHDR